MANLRYVSSQARGEMVAVLDDDDRLLPGFLSAASEPMQRDETVGIVFTGFLREAGGARRAYQFPISSGRVQDPLGMVLAGRQPGRSAALIRRTALEQGERAFPLLDDQIGDLTTWIRTAAAGWGFWFVPEPHVVVSVHRGQMSASEHPTRLIDTLERFDFDDPAVESARRARLADARRRYALSLTYRGRIGAARRQLALAADAAPWPSPLRTLGSVAAHSPALHRLSVRRPRLGDAMHKISGRITPRAER